MVRFEQDKIVVELENMGAPVEQWLNLLHALFLVGSFVADHAEKDAGSGALSAYSTLAYSLGTSLTKLEEGTLRQLEQTVNQENK